MTHREKLQQKVIEVFGPWDQIAKWTKERKLEYDRLLNSRSRKERSQTIGFQDALVRGALRFYYTTNDNAQGGRSNGGGRGWYVSGPVTPGCYQSKLVMPD